MSKINYLKIILMSVIFVSCSVPITSEEVEGEGSSPTSVWNGFTSTKPPQVNGVYIITTGEHLAWLTLVRIQDVHVRFDANIDMNNKSFKGIKHFKGIMDGNGKRIKNLKINAPTTDTIGLIHLLTGDGSEIKNLTIESGSIKGKKDTGAFVGKSEDSVTLTGLTNKASVETLDASSGGIISFSSGDIKINNVQNTGTITGSFITGGILGYSLKNTEINNAQNHGAITGRTIGGIIGVSLNTTKINKVENSGTVIGTGDAGGIIGNSRNALAKARINNTKNSGTITSTGQAGGIIGSNSGSAEATLDNVQNTGAITSNDRGGGGIVGFNSGTVVITLAENSGTVTGTSYRTDVGGIVGYTERRITIKNSKNSAKITGTSTSTGKDSDAGGMIGHATTDTGEVIVENAQNLGNVFGSKGNAGGMIGKADGGEVKIDNAQNSANIESAYFAAGIIGFINKKLAINNAGNSGKITGTSKTGGIIGKHGGGLTTIGYTYNYTDMKLVGWVSGSVTRQNSYRLDSSAGELGVTALSVEEFKTKSSFGTSWDWSIWEIVNGKYPTLKHFNP